jgi:hypothetical protein
VERVLDIPNMLIVTVRNMDSITSPSSTMDAPLTVFSAKTGRIENGFGIKRGSHQMIWPKPLMNVLVAYATSVAIQLLNYLIPSKFLNRRWRGPLIEFFGSVGRRMVP